MGLTSTKKIETNRYELVIEVGGDEFAPAVDRAFKKNVSKLNVPGFRKGKAPKAVVYKMYGEGVFYEDAVNELYPKAYHDAVEEAKLEPVDYPQIDVTAVSKDGFTFTATVVNKPEVEVSGYKGIKASKTVKTVTDEDIGAEIERLQKRNARILTVGDRAAKLGDTVVIDFQGFVDGEELEGGGAQNHTLKLGSGQFIPGFEDQIVGHSAGEEFEINVTFPEDYHPELKGQAAMFKVKLHEIKEEELPAADDEFAKDVSEFDTLDELKNSIRERLIKQNEDQAQSNFEDTLVDKVIENMKAEIPEEMVEAKIREMIRDYQYRLQSQGIPLETYLQYTGQTVDAFKETFRQPAGKQVRIRLALEKIAQLENICPTDEAVEEEYKRLADQYHNDVEKIRGMISQADVRMDLAVRGAIDLIRDSAEIVEEEPATNEAVSGDPSSKSAEEPKE